jgi:hypothetical protein
MHKNYILVYSSYVSFIDSYQLVKSPKYRKKYWMMSCMDYIIFACSGRYDKKLCTKMNTNALETILLKLVYSSFLSFVALFQHVKSLKCIKLFWMMSNINLYYTHYFLEALRNIIERLTKMHKNCI